MKELRAAIEDELLSSDPIYFGYDRSNFIFGKNGVG